MSRMNLVALLLLLVFPSCSTVFHGQKVSKTENLVNASSGEVEVKAVNIPVKKTIVGTDIVNYNDDYSYRFGVFPGVETLVVGELDVVSLDQAEVIKVPPPPPQAKRIPLQIMYSGGSNETLPSKELPKEPEKKVIEKKIEVFFNFNKGILTKDQKERFLSEVREFKKNYKEVSAEVYGYACFIGSESYNLKLSKRRALFVKNLLEKEGVRVEIVKGLGETRKEGVVCLNRKAIVILKAKE
ncbi:MAG: OmpA family protein [Caldisericum sp.]